MSSLDEGGVWDPGEKSGEPITDFDRKVWRALAKGGQWLPKEHKSYMVDYLSLNQPPLHIGQVFGFQQYTPNAAEVATEEGTTSATYTDLTTPGPSLTQLPDGLYVVDYGASLQAPAGQTVYMSLSANGAAAADTSAVESSTTTNLSLSRKLLVELTAGSNTLTAKYRISGGGSAGNARYRWLIATKYANP